MYGIIQIKKGFCVLPSHSVIKWNQRKSGKAPRFPAKGAKPRNSGACPVIIEQIKDNDQRNSLIGIICFTNICGQSSQSADSGLKSHDNPSHRMTGFFLLVLVVYMVVGSSL